MGALLYIANNTQPDISASVSILAQKVTNPMKRDWIEVQRVFRYLKNTIDLKLQIKSSPDQSTDHLIAYVDADWGSNLIDRKSNSGYCVFLNGNLMTWSSTKKIKEKKQKCVSLSSTEAEYVALTELTTELEWYTRLLSEIGVNVTPIIFEDNQSCIKLTKNDQLKKRTKHIDTKYHYIRDLVNKNKINIKYLPSEDMIADILTKPLDKIKLRKFRKGLGLI
ncbi:uncharacterized protein [Onthophagus taurus]|uniref:uncharacterized protein n=1 Tax=Onthophagus taurus TaxID=166361 RepID=UPI0039BDDE41